MTRSILFTFLAISTTGLLSCGGATPNTKAIEDTSQRAAEGEQDATDLKGAGDTKGAQDKADERQPDLEALLTDSLAGRFDSSQQAQADERYFNISLKGCRVEAPDFGPHVLYIEQAAAAKLDSPYRQRLYVIRANEDGSVTSTIYALNKPESAVGLCDRDAPVTFTAADAALREGCEVTLKWTGGKFVGATEGKGCGSTLRGATYATSEVEVGDDRITSWDRGYDDKDAQVWGAEAGPYVFIRND